MEAKKRLAHEVVALLHDGPSADAAQAEFERVIQGGEAAEVVAAKKLLALIKELETATGGQIEIRGETGQESDNTREIRVPFSHPVGLDFPPGWMSVTNATFHLPRIILDAGMVASMSEAKRLISQGAIRVNGQRVESEWLANAQFTDGTIIQIGRHRFLRIVDAGA